MAKDVARVILTQAGPGVEACFRPILAPAFLKDESALSPELKKRMMEYCIILIINEI